MVCDEEEALGEDEYRRERIWEYTWRERVPEPLADAVGGSVRVRTFRIVGWFENDTFKGEVLTAIHFEELTVDALGEMTWNRIDITAAERPVAHLLQLANLLGKDVSIEDL